MSNSHCEFTTIQLFLILLIIVNLLRRNYFYFYAWCMVRPLCLCAFNCATNQANSIFEDNSKVWYFFQITHVLDIPWSEYFLLFIIT